jgi:hypothetical protein
MILCMKNGFFQTRIWKMRSPQSPTDAGLGAFSTCGTARFGHESTHMSHAPDAAEEPSVEAFITRWENTEAAERADLIGVPQPVRAMRDTGDPLIRIKARQAYREDDVKAEIFEEIG